MNPKDYSFLLLMGKMGDPARTPLTTAQLRLLTQRICQSELEWEDRELEAEHLLSLGLPTELCQRILSLLADDYKLKRYVDSAEHNGFYPVTRTDPQYPLILRKRLGLEAPGCIWFKGNWDIIQQPAVALVGSRNISKENLAFAQEVGRQAARQGFTLVSGNARGADRAAQDACLQAGGNVVVVTAEALPAHDVADNLLFLSEEDFDEPFSIYRALHRNRIIHALGEMTFVAQCSLGKGGTWNGTMQNLRNHWTPVFSYQDNSEAARSLEVGGAALISKDELRDFSSLVTSQLSFL